MPEAFVIGSGPNGLTAAITLARAGLKTTVLEAQSTIGGGTRSAALTLPGFTHDVCSAVHPLAISSRAFASMPLAQHGLEWVHPPVPLAHPLDDGRAVAAYRSVAETAAQLGEDARAYKTIAGSLADRWTQLITDVLAPPTLPAHPLTFASFGALAAWPAASSARALFRTTEARALFAGMAAHSIAPLESPGTSAFGWLLGLSAHAVGWPIPRGGSQRIADALASYFASLGGAIVANHRVSSVAELPPDALVLCDITPRGLLRIAASLLPEAYCRTLEAYRYGPGVFKLDWALNAPIPWSNAECRRAGTLHLGGTLEEIAASERTNAPGLAPFVLLAQPSLFDPTRAPAGQHTAWAYCHVPNGSAEDATERIERQVERFAPGFRATILAAHRMAPADLEAHNENLVGGDIGGGAATPLQLFRRPTWSFYRTPSRRLFLCSASTPPGAGVHGLCGYHAARLALATLARPLN